MKALVPKLGIAKKVLKLKAKVWNVSFLCSVFGSVPDQSL